MSNERKGPVIFRIPGTDDASAAAAVSRMGGFTERDKDIALRRQRQANGQKEARVGW